MMIEMRHAPRQRVTEKKSYSMSVISFKRLEWNDLVVRVVDISPQGAGIEVESGIEPGFVWFSNKVDDKKGGLLMWSKQFGGRYRGGIKFVPLSVEEEQSTEQRLTGSGPFRDPTAIVDTIIESLKKSGGGSIVQTR